MKTILGIIAFVIAISLGSYMSSREAKPETVFTESELGIEFSYRAGTDGYVLEEMTPSGEETSLEKTIVLTRSEDKLSGAPIGGEGSPTITINIFKNPKKQWSTTWADENIQYSNINLKIGDVMETVVGGANAVRYMADGLYVSENVVVAHGERMYVITGMFLDEDSDLRRDFGPLVDSLKFIQ